MREWEENRTSKPPPTPSVKKIRKYKRAYSSAMHWALHCAVIKLYMHHTA